MQFPETRWTALARATMNGDPAGRAALEALCRAYWRPVRDFIRFRGYSEADADDLTQSFLLRLCQQSVWRAADAERGRFRSFLLGALSHFLADEMDRRQAAKRGGGVEHLPVDGRAPDLSAPTPSDAAHFDREWAMAIVREALDHLSADFTGKAEEWGTLSHFLPGSREPLALEEGARRLGCGLAAMKSQVHRLRARFRDLIRERVALTVDTPAELDEELRHLGRVLMDRGTSL